MRVGTATLAAVLALALASSHGTVWAQVQLESRHFQTSDGVQLHYLEGGAGPTLVFVPGFAFPAEVWEQQLTHFAASYRVVALDPRSQGRSEKPTEGHHHARRGADIGDLLDHLGGPPPVVVGWSLAVREILTLAREREKPPFRAVVLVDMSLGVDAPLGEPHPNQAGWTHWMASWQLDRHAFTRAWVRAMYRRAQPEEYLEAMSSAVLSLPTNTAVTLLANLMLLEERDLRPVVASLDLPILFIASSQAWAVAVAEETRTRWPHIQVEVLEDTGHAVFADDPKQFNRVLGGFLDAQQQQ